MSKYILLNYHLSELNEEIYSRITTIGDYFRLIHRKKDTWWCIFGVGNILPPLSSKRFLNSIKIPNVYFTCLIVYDRQEMLQSHKINLKAKGRFFYDWISIVFFLLFIPHNVISAISCTFSTRHMQYFLIVLQTHWGIGHKVSICLYAMEVNQRKRYVGKNTVREKNTTILIPKRHLK